MPIDAEEVRRIAELARLELDDATVETFRHQLQACLDYVAALDDLDLEAVPPTPRPATSGQEPREDRRRDGLSVEEALHNAPDASGGHFRVPRVIKG